MTCAFTSNYNYNINITSIRKHLPEKGICQIKWFDNVVTPCITSHSLHFKMSKMAAEVKKHRGKENVSLIRKGGLYGLVE